MIGIGGIGRVGGCTNEAIVVGREREGRQTTLIVPQFL